MGPYFWGITHLTSQELQFIGDLKGLGFRLQGLGLSDARCPPGFRAHKLRLRRPRNPKLKILNPKP